ncbi:enoyl-CoA hydratase-related protein [Bosea sp. (in: a-proteobacteria)]|uniref:enoyl-CoA hydratase/isomerase family protein n=1 Tax=Bosea sp. (in: a-proteobacteria) TaxID=1871050 RepID=UPI00262B9611|nr:enoyl-CoA hydratase-related protein [Bosea sp. (in: a-proteobacteria)]MCO5091210.1 enoyl-CoA hydratase-related protein [Bosea sp. (in: a-proteobacteria)]
MTVFDDYKDRFSHIAMQRSASGVLEMRLHTDGGPFDVNTGGRTNPQAQLGDAFALIAADPENRVVLLTGTGASFSGPRKTLDMFSVGDTQRWERIRRDGVRLLMNFMDIDAPVISCINGPALRHAELPLLGDIVLADSNAVIQDSAHFTNRTVPGDGINVVLPMVLGLNRGRHLLLTGKTIDAAELLAAGAVAEVLPPDRLVARGREIAEEIAGNNPLVIRYTKLVLRRAIRRELQDVLEFSLSLEALAAVDETARLKEARR